jgi:hypothetical protein
LNIKCVFSFFLQLLSETLIILRSSERDIAIKLKVKQSHYRPRQALKLLGVLGSQISRLSAHEGGKVVSLTHRLPLPPGLISGTHFC